MTEKEIKKAQALIGKVLNATGAFAVGACTREELRRSEDTLIQEYKEWSRYRAQLGTKYNYDVVEKALGMKDV